MANKGTNKAGRREEVRMRREVEARRRARVQAMRRMRRTIVVMLIVGALISPVMINASKGSKARARLQQVAATAGCGKIVTPPGQGQGHLEAGQTFKYNSDPPTSGTHSSSTAATGVHTEPIPDENQVHNLEHGNIGIQYNEIDPTLIDQLAGVVKTNPTRIFLAPKTTLASKNVVFSAWGTFLDCPNPTTKVVDVAKAWVVSHVGKGPEGDIPGSPVGV